MGIPFDKLAGALKAGASAKRDSDVPVRVSVFVDRTATPFQIEALRGALVPQTTAALVRVARLGDADPQVKPDTDVSIVLTCGSDGLEQAVQKIVIGGAPTVVVTESAVEAPFITADTPMLGLVSATDKTYLLETLARWILDHTEKDTAFAANFPFMRIAAANRVIVNAAIGNLATGALVFIPGADFPVMAAAQLGMMAQLAMIFGKPIRAERGYEAAGVIAAGLVLRAVTRQLVKPAGHAGFIVKALVGGFGTYAIGRALTEVYGRDIDYSRANQVVASVASRGRELVSVVTGKGGKAAAAQDAVASPFGKAA